MEGLRLKIQADMKDAMRSKDEAVLGVLRMCIAAFEKRATEKRTATGDATLSPEDEIVVLRGEVKRRKESKDIFEKNGRQDLAEKEAFEINVLSGYLPPELSKEEIIKVVEDAIKSIGASGVKDFGKVMKEAMKVLGSRASGDAVSAVIKESLNS